MKAAQVWLAPMSGSTDAPFRRQVSRFGDVSVVSEMVAGEALAAARPDMVRRTCRHDGAGEWIVQLAARRPEDMRAGAELLREAGVDVIDINMGCPSKQVTGGQSGSALMREPELAQRIVDAALEGANGVPVTLKMRLGWDHASLNAPQIAQAAESSGVQLITVHGRTRCQFYKGNANWREIRNTVDAVQIPVVANGDISDAETARSALAQSGAAGIMIGRAALGRPWLLARIAAELDGRDFPEPSAAEICESLCAQIRDSVDLYGERLGVRIVRKHVSATIDHAPLDLRADRRRELRATLCRIGNADDLIASLETLFAVQPGKLAA